MGDWIDGLTLLLGGASVGRVREAYKADTRACILALLLFGLLGGLVACASSGEPPMVTPTFPPTPVLAPRPTASVHQARVSLIVCMAEPESAHPLVPSETGQELLALFYEPPIERVRYRWEPRLVERVPTLETGDVITRLVKVNKGSRYADPLGFVHTYTGTESLQLPRLVVTFTLKSGLKWSDGAPLTARDAVLGYHLAQSEEVKGSWHALARRTSRFVAVDDLTLRWEGIPGFLSADYPGFLFPLQPAHRWQGQTFGRIVQDRTPPASGPFRIVAWESGREVRLEPNPYYVGLEPSLQRITVRFLREDPADWGYLLRDGTCDIVLPPRYGEVPWDLWARLSADGSVVLWADVAPTLLRVELNTSPITETHPVATPLQDARVRRALALCVDRVRLLRFQPGEALEAAQGFIPPNHPASPDVEGASYDPIQGAQLLEEAGWLDRDGDGVREAHGVAEIEEGQPLSLTLNFAPQYFAMAAYVAADLGNCGVKVTLQPMDARQLYASSPESPLLGRRFQMALIGWQVTVPQICGAWLSQRIPSMGNQWIGENFSGFASSDYDHACLGALNAVDFEAQTRALQEAQRILNDAAPSIFVAWRPFWFAARPDVKGLVPDASAPGALWNIEAVGFEERPPTRSE